MSLQGSHCRSIAINAAPDTARTPPPIRLGAGRGRGRAVKVS